MQHCTASGYDAKPGTLNSLCSHLFDLILVVTGKFVLIQHIRTKQIHDTTTKFDITDYYRAVDVHVSGSKTSLGGLSQLVRVP